MGILWSIPWWSIWGPFLGQFVDGIQLVTTHLPKVAKPQHTHLLSVTWLPGKELVSSTQNKVFTWHIVQSCSNRRIDQSSWVAIGRIHPNRLEVHCTAGAASFGHLSHVTHLGICRRMSGWAAASCRWLAAVTLLEGGICLTHTLAFFTRFLHA